MSKTKQAGFILAANFEDVLTEATPTLVSDVAPVFCALDGGDLLTPTQAFFTVAEAEQSIAFIKDQKTLGASDEYSSPILPDVFAPDVRLVADDVAGVRSTEWLVDDHALLIETDDGFDPVDTMLNVNRALREAFGARADQLRLHAL